MNDADPETRITFRALTADDLPLVVRWLNTPHVREWWGDDPRTLEDARTKSVRPCGA